MSSRSQTSDVELRTQSLVRFLLESSDTPQQQIEILDAQRPSIPVPRPKPILKSVLGDSNVLQPDFSGLQDTCDRMSSLQTSESRASPFLRFLLENSNASQMEDYLKEKSSASNKEDPPEVSEDGCVKQESPETSAEECVEQEPEPLEMHVEEDSTSLFEDERSNEEITNSDCESSQQISNEDLSPFSCIWCQESFSQSSLRETHMKLTHRQKYLELIQKYLIVNCGKGQQFHTPIPQENNVTSCGNDISVKSSSKENTESQKLSTSPKIFSAKEELKKSVQSSGRRQSLFLCPENKDRKLESEVIPYKFRSGERKCNNIKAVRLSFKCEICNKLFKYKRCYDTHLKSHFSHRRYTCDLCNKRFLVRSGMSRHMVTHLEDMPVKCKSCNKTFLYESALRQHLKIHSNERPFKCKMCSKSFYVINNLNQHMRIHSKERLYVCEVCGKTFNYISNLRAHRRRPSKHHHILLE